MARGAVRQETLLIGGVVLVAIGVLVGFGWRVSQRRGALDEGARMRQLYVALSVYESQADGEISPHLPALRPYLAADRDFLSSADPFRASKGPFPADAGLPESRRISTFRVSDAYLPAHRQAKRISVPEWRTARMDPTLGIFANEWHGSVQAGAPFDAKVGGLVLRITTDGAMVRVNRAGPKPVGDADDLFRIRADRR